MILTNQTIVFEAIGTRDLVCPAKIELNSDLLPE